MLQVVIAFIVEAFVLKIQAAIKRRVCQKHPKNSNCGCPGLEGISVAFLAVMNMQGHRNVCWIACKCVDVTHRVLRY